MAPKVKKGDGVSTQPPRPPRKWLLVGGVVVLVGAGLGGTWFWRAHSNAARIESVLPNPPALSGKAEILAGLLADAERKAKTPSSTTEGVAELGRLYHANDFIAEAAVCWEFLRHEQPNEPRWLYYLADIRRLQSEYSDHAELLEKTLALAPDYAPAHLQLANLVFKSGDLAAAARHYELRLRALPKDPYARLGLARIALQQHRRDDAKSLLQQLLADSPHFSSGHNLYAELLAAEGSEDDANRHRWLGRETLRYREPADPWLDELRAWCYDYDRLCVFGTIEFQADQFDPAANYFERAIRVDRHRPDAYELLGSLYLKRGDAARARSLLETALPLLPPTKSSRIVAFLSQAQRELKQPAEALQTARLGLQQAGPHADLLDALAHALAETGQHEEAVTTWQDALAKSPGDAGMNFNLAKSYLALRRLDDALAALDRSLTLQPTYLPTLLLRGEIELQANHLDVAENYLRPAFESHPEDPDVRRLFAQLHLRRAAAAEASGDRNNAERHYRDGLLVDDQHPELLVRLGLFYLLNNRPDEAVRPLASFHQLQPESAPGCLFLGQAYLATNDPAKARELLTKGVQLAERSGNSRIANECRALLQRL